MTNEEGKAIYDAEILPLLEQVRVLCVKHDFPFLAMVDLNEKTIEVTGRLTRPDRSMPLFMAALAAQSQGDVDMLVMMLIHASRDYPEYFANSNLIQSMRRIIDGA